MLGWFCEQRGIPFRIVDRGHAGAASRVGAGLISPLTGQRLAPTWKFAEWRDEVLAIYRSLEEELAEPLVRELHIERRYRDARQRELFQSRLDRPEVAPWIERGDEDALRMRGALQVNTGRLIAKLRERWRRSGVLREGGWTEDQASGDEAVVWCTGAAMPQVQSICWEPSRGEIARGRVAGLDPDVVLNNGHWLLPLEEDRALVGALFDRSQLGAGVTVAGQRELATAVEQLTGQPWREARGDSGLRINVPDRRPVVGWLDATRRCGLFNGLAAKGALWAPILAKQWCEDGMAGGRLDPAVRADRFGRAG